MLISSASQKVEDDPSLGVKENKGHLEASDVQKKVAQFGSRLTDLESQLTKSETDLRADLGEIKHNMVRNEVCINHSIQT